MSPEMKVFQETTIRCLKGVLSAWENWLKAQK